MKTLVLRRHSTKDGPNDTIGPKGILLARREGLKYQGEDDHHLFHGPLVRTCQTALAFASRLDYQSLSHPVVDGLGSQAMFGDMVTDGFKAEVKAGRPNFDALLAAHGVDRCRQWAVEICLPAVKQMFDALGDNETGVGFFHSPTIELAAWAVHLTNPPLGVMPDEYKKLGDLDGITFQQDENDAITLGAKISVEPLSESELTEAGILA